MAQLNGFIDKVVALLGEFGGTQISGEVNKVINLSGEVNKVINLMGSFGVGFKPYVQLTDYLDELIVDYNGDPVWVPANQ